MSKLITTDSLAKLSAGLDARYKSLINDSVSDMVGNSVDAAQATILVEVKKQVDAVKDMLGGKSLVYLTQAEYDALSEEKKNDENIVYNITDSESADHEHENLEFLNKITAINITIGKKTQALDFNGNLNFSLEDIGVDNNHKHDEYYTEEEINNVVSDLEALISGKSDTGHNHDDRYYTESEMNTKLADKASKDHSHDEFDTFAIKSEMNSALEGKANKQHEHNEYVTTLKLEEELESVEESINSVSQSVTTLDTTLRGEIGKKADSGHNHNDLYLTKEEVSEDISEAITNQNSELTAEINRVESMLGGKSIVYITQAEYDALSESEKTNELKTYFITDADDSHNHDDLYYTEDEINTLLAGKSDLGHDHNDKYYTETEVNTKLAEKSDKTHGHSDLATTDSLNSAVNTINAAIAKKSDSTHKHDNDYYNKTDATSKFNDIEGDITSLGQEITALNTSISSAETRAKNYADQKITALVNSAPTAMDTLGELAKAISDHQDVYDAYVAQVSSDLEEMGVALVEAAMELDETLHNIISVEIDTDVKAEKDRAMDAEEALQNAINGKANASHGTHVTYATTAPSAPGTASAGSSSSVARADHVHPAQTTISGNAGSATKLATGRAIKLTGMVSGQATFDGTADATITVSAAKVPKSGDWWSGGFATVNTDGVMEVGKYLDFHNTDTGTNDYDVRLQSNTSTPCIITLPTSTGTLALKTDKPETAGVADSVKQSLTVQLNGGTTEGTNKFTFNGSTAKSINITPANIGASATGHNHNDSYYTKSQVDTSIAGITVDSLQAAPKTHTHNQINSRGNVTAETANNRPAVGGLSMSCAYSNGYPTTYGNVMTMKGTGDGQLLIGWSGTSGAHAPAYIRSRRDTTDANWSEWAQIYTTANKPSCNDIGAAPKDNTVATVSVSGGKLTLTKDKRQKCTSMISGTEIVFPTVSNTEFLEIHLYFNAESDMSLILPDCKWRVDPNLEAGKSYELVATWNTMNWLANLIVYS